MAIRLFNSGADAEKSSMRSHRLLAIALTVAAAMSVACNPFNLSPSDSSSSTTTGPQTDTFSGSLSPGNSLTFTYTVTTAGAVGVALTAVTPSTTSALGLGIGPSSGGTCTVTNSTSAAIAGSAVLLSATENPGTYCVKVSDLGNLATTSSVTVTVAHS
jgi:hypothetical protein